MSYEDLREYLRRLRNLPEVRIHWDSVDPGAVSAVSHDPLAGLQIVDAVATGAFYSVHRISARPANSFIATAQSATSIGSTDVTSLVNDGWFPKVDLRDLIDAITHQLRDRRAVYRSSTTPSASSPRMLFL